MIKLIIDEDEASQRLDRYLKKVFNRLPASLIYKLIRTGKVVVNQKLATINQKLEVSDEVRILEELKFEPPEPVSVDVSLSLSSAFEKMILYEDDDVIVINKAAGIASHAGSRHESGNLSQMLLCYLGWDRPKIHGFKPALINRLDKDTSGLILAAKSGIALRKLNLDSRSKELDKVYLALVCNAMPSKAGEFSDLLIGSDGSKSARLEYKVRRFWGDLLRLKLKDRTFSLVEVKLITGRTHQIRVQFASRSHPIVGDRVYGDEEINSLFRARFGLKRHFLHSHLIGFCHPRSGKRMRFPSDLPADLRKICGVSP